jgi:hypothetical protein
VWDQWWSIEVLDGPFSAEVWFDAHGSALVEAAITNRAVDWFVHRRRWGLVFEVRFGDDDAWLRFRGLPGVRAALDAVPDPVNGLLIYRGRGGGAGAGVPRRPRPTLGAGAASLPEPVEPFLAAGDGPPDDDLNDALEEAVPGPRPLGPAVTPAGKPRDPG